MRLTSDGDLNASGGSKVESSLKTTSATSGQVHLGTNTINELRAAVVDRLDEVDESSELRVRAVEVVIVDVQLGVGVSLARGLEGNGDEALAKDVGEDGGAQTTIFVEDLVHDIPGADLSSVTACNGGDVILDDGGQGGLVADGGHPGRELRMPDWLKAH